MAKLDALGGGRFRVSGVLDASTVGELLEQSRSSFNDSPQIQIDLAGVTEGDSAGLALLIEWLRTARERKQAILIEHLPTQISALARISEVEDLLGATGSAAPRRPGRT